MLIDKDNSNINDSMYDTQWKLNLSNSFYKQSTMTPLGENDNQKTHRTVMPDDDQSMDEADIDSDRQNVNGVDFKEESMFVPYEDSWKSTLKKTEMSKSTF